MIFLNESSYCDHRSMKDRSLDFIDIYLPDMEKATGGRFSIQNLINSASVLDVGCGSGALAYALRSMQFNGQIVGIDPNYPYKGETAYDLYQEIIPEDIRRDDVLSGLVKYKFNNIMCIGLPPEVTRFILTNKKKFKLENKGSLVIATEHDIEVPAGIEKFKGNYSADSHIYISKQ